MPSHKSALVLFYQNRAADNQGRMIEEILKWDDEKLERVHDYIQWLFPLPEPSGFNSNAPQLSRDDIADFVMDAQVRTNMLRSFERMLSFYGLEQSQSKETVRRAVKFPERSSSWLSRGNHNFLRITRILHSLFLTGFEKQSEAFYKCLVDIYGANKTIIGSATFEYWRNAVKKS